MNDSSSEPKNQIKSAIKVEHQILKEYSQSYYWGNKVESVKAKVAPGVIKFFLSKAITSKDAKLDTTTSIRVFWRVRGRMSGHNSQQIDALILGDYVNLEYRSDHIILESVELFINKAGDIVSDIKLTFFDLQKGDRDSHQIIEVEPMYITVKKLTKMSNLYDFITDLIDVALKENKS